MRGRDWIEGLLAPPRPLPPMRSVPAPPPPPEPTWSDLLAQVRAENPGRGQAAAYLAAALGVAPDTARRYLRGTQAPTRSRVRTALAGEYAAARARAEQRQQAAHREAQESEARAYRAAEAYRQARHRRDIADLLRRVRAVNPGKVTVRNISGPSGTSSRNVGRVEVDLSKVASLWDNGRFDAAAAALSDTIIDAYGDQRGRTGGGLSAYLEITDYPQGMRYE